VDRTIISKWNRSFGLDLDKEAIKKLAASIKKHGLLHPIILVRIPGKENWYAIVCGAHRFEAIKLNRKGDAFLRPGEYHILPDLTEEDDACLDISVSENADRNDLSPYATARYVKRLQKEEGLDQTVIAGRLGMQREVVNALTVLPEHYADLPEKWQKGLNTVCDSDHSTKLVITVSHWRKVKAYVEKHGMTQELHDLLEAAADKKWSTKRLGDEVGDLKEADKGGGPGGDDGCPTISSGKGSTEPEGNGDNGGTEEGADNPDDPQPDHQEASELAGILEAAIKLKDQAREYDNIVQLLNPVIEEVEKMQKAAAKEEAA
jgi:ParB/RepB/Spo0J family partition protein